MCAIPPKKEYAFYGDNKPIWTNSISTKNFFSSRDIPENVGEDAEEADLEMPKVYEPVNF